jgi:hypothetical protein
VERRSGCILSIPKLMTIRSFAIVWSWPRFRALSSVSLWIFVGSREVPLVDQSYRAVGSQDADPVVGVAVSEDESRRVVESGHGFVRRRRAVYGDACLPVCR